jgi:hypothetical protein
MLGLARTGNLKSHSRTRPIVKPAVPETEYSGARVARHLGRVIVGWLAIIIVIQLAVKYFGSN